MSSDSVSRCVERAIPIWFNSSISTRARNSSCSSAVWRRAKWRLSKAAWIVLATTAGCSGGARKLKTGVPLPSGGNFESGESGRIRRQDIDQPRPVLGNRVAQSGGKDRGILSDHHERARFVRGKVFREREHAANQYCVPPVSVMPVIPEMPPWPTQFPENRLPTKRPLRSLATSRVR